MTVTQKILNAVRSVDENGRMLIAAIAAAVAQAQGRQDEKKEKN